MSVPPLQCTRIQTRSAHQDKRACHHLPNTTRSHANGDHIMFASSSCQRNKYIPIFNRIFTCLAEVFIGSSIEENFKHLQCLWFLSWPPPHSSTCSHCRSCYMLTHPPPKKMQRIALVLAVCIACCVANTHFDKVSEEFVAKPNGQTAVVKVEMVIESPFPTDRELTFRNARAMACLSHVRLHTRLSVAQMSTGSFPSNALDPLIIV